MRQQAHTMTNKQDGESVISEVRLPFSRQHLLFTEEAAMQSVKLTEPRLRLVLMLCFPLSPSSSSLTGLNIKGGGSTGFSMGGSSPYFLK